MIDILWYMAKSGIAGSWGKMIHNFLSNWNTDFQHGCTSLQTHRQWRSVPRTPHPLQHKSIFVFRKFSILFWLPWGFVGLGAVCGQTVLGFFFLEFRSLLYFYGDLCFLIVAIFIMFFFFLSDWYGECTGFDFINLFIYYSLFELDSPLNMM